MFRSSREEWPSFALAGRVEFDTRPLLASHFVKCIEMMLKYVSPWYCLERNYLGSSKGSEVVLPVMLHESFNIPRFTDFTCLQLIKVGHWRIDRCIRANGDRFFLKKMICKEGAGVENRTTCWTSVQIVWGFRQVCNRVQRAGVLLVSHSQIRCFRTS